MKQYIGTKLIEAEKAYRVNGEAAAENCCCDKDCECSCCDKETAADEPAVPKLPTVRYADGYGVARIELPEEG